jgi:hypothetical protein
VRATSSGFKSHLQQSTLGLGLLANHDDRAIDMSRDVLAYRSQEHPGEPAVATRADHEHIGVLGEIDEQFRRVALLDLRMYERLRITASKVCSVLSRSTTLTCSLGTASD